MKAVSFINLRHNLHELYTFSDLQVIKLTFKNLNLCKKIMCHKSALTHQHTYE